MQISEAESVVMDVLWRRHPLGAEDVVAELADSRHWQEATIKTLLNRLLNKGAIAAERDGRRYLYSPLLKREAWVLEESRGLLDRLFDGRVAPLVAHFSEQRKLSRKDIAELRGAIEKHQGSAHCAWAGREMATESNAKAAVKTTKRPGIFLLLSDGGSVCTSRCHAIVLMLFEVDHTIDDMFRQPAALYLLS